MVREICTVNVGQCGIQLGAAVWAQYLAEHAIDNMGKKEDKSDLSFMCFFEETGAGQFSIFQTAQIQMKISSSFVCTDTSLAT